MVQYKRSILGVFGTVLQCAQKWQECSHSSGIIVRGTNKTKAVFLISERVVRRTMRFLAFQSLVLNDTPVRGR